MFEMKKNCKDCGLDISGTHYNTIRCKPCQKKANYKKILEYLKSNRGRKKLYQSIYKYQATEKCKMTNLDRRAKLYNMEQNQLINLLSKCSLCDWKNNISLHHIIPRKAGGENSFDNITGLCPNHHKLIHNPAFSHNLTKELLEQKMSLKNYNTISENEIIKKEIKVS